MRKNFIALRLVFASTAVALLILSTAVGRAVHESVANASARFAVIGDYGDYNRQSVQNVADLINSWGVDFIVTTGDNTYCDGSQWDECVGAYYGSYISSQRFWPSLGNHDWDAGIGSYTSYFSYLPGNKRYYDFVRGNVHFFILDSDFRESNGVTSDSTQGQWLQSRLASASEPWKVVVFHHPPLSGGPNGSSDWMQWPFKHWGATAVLAGHDHLYERLEVDNIPYIVNGLGGRSIYDFEQGDFPETRARYNDDYGALLVESGDCEITFQFVTRSYQEVDTYTQSHCANPTDTPTPTPTSTSTPEPTDISTPNPHSTPTSTRTDPASNPTPTVRPTLTPTSLSKYQYFFPFVSR